MTPIILETAVGREKDVQDIDAHGEFEKIVVSLLVMKGFQQPFRGTLDKQILPIGQIGGFFTIAQLNAARVFIPVLPTPAHIAAEQKLTG